MFPNQAAITRLVGAILLSEQNDEQAVCVYISALTSLVSAIRALRHGDRAKDGMISSDNGHQQQD